MVLTRRKSFQTTIMNNKISDKISDYDLESIAMATDFIIRPVKKISPESYIDGFFKTMVKGEYTVKNWARAIGICNESLVSKQAVLKRLSYRHVDFSNKFLMEVVSKECGKLGGAEQLFDNTLFSYFGKVLIEDSTCLSLPRNLTKIFRSSYSKNQNASTAKLQLRMDLQTGRFQKIDIGDFTDSDGSYAWDILSTLEQGDLVMRDLGYWNIKIFEAISKSQAYYVSLWKKHVTLFDEQDKRVELIEMLKKVEEKGRKVLDKKVKIGLKDKVKTRLVALKLPKKIANKRRKQALKERDKRINAQSPEYQYLLGWEIFITNVPTEIWTPQQLSKAYGFRWRIEIIFKCWKSKLGIAKIFEKTEMSHPHALIALILTLAWITLAFLDEYLYYSRQVFKKKGTFLSILQFANFYRDYLNDIKHWDKEKIIDFIAYYYTYDKRKKRTNHMKKHMTLS